MNAKKIIGVLLIIASVYIGYLGVNKVSNNEASVEILDTKIGVSNKSGKTEGYIYIGLGIVLFAGGIRIMK
jgi:hypothetical protein